MWAELQSGSLSVELLYRCHGGAGLQAGWLRRKVLRPLGFCKSETMRVSYVCRSGSPAQVDLNTSPRHLQQPKNKRQALLFGTFTPFSTHSCSSVAPQEPTSGSSEPPSHTVETGRHQQVVLLVLLVLLVMLGALAVLLEILDQAVQGENNPQPGSRPPGTPALFLTCKHSSAIEQPPAPLLG